MPAARIWGPVGGQVTLETTALAKLTVHWPWGEDQVFTGLSSDRYWKLTEGEAKPK